MAQFQMSDQEKLTVGFRIKDKDNQVFTHADQLPEGSVVTIESSDPSTVGVEMWENGLNATLTSIKPGSATVTGTLSIPSSVDLPNGLSAVETNQITVTFTPPASAEFTVGAPEPE